MSGCPMSYDRYSKYIYYILTLLHNLYLGDILSHIFSTRRIEDTFEEEYVCMCKRMPREEKHAISLYIVNSISSDGSISK